MSEQELNDLKQRVDRLDKMHNVAFAVIILVGGYYLISKLMK